MLTKEYTQFTGRTVVSIEGARARKDIREGDLRQRVSIEWRGTAYQLTFDDFENDPPDVEWLRSELVHISERLGDGA